MRTLTLFLLLVAMVTTEDKLKCYENCGKNKTGDISNDVPCDTSKQTECRTGQVCSTQKYSYKANVDGVISSDKTEITKKLCDTKTNHTEAYCHTIKTGVSAGGVVADFECEIEFCDKDLCNAGFTTRVSLLVLAAAGVLIFRLF